jgi:GNAT superfamily N-acetyltransferase
MDEFPGVKIARVTQADEALFAACQRLVPQLTDTAPPPTQAELELLVASPCSLLFKAQQADFGEEIIGLATLLLYRVPTGLRGYIEDVVVDERVRGRRIGEALTWACLDAARYSELLLRAAGTMLEPFGISEDLLRQWLFSNAAYAAPPGRLPGKRATLPLLMGGEKQ